MNTSILKKILSIMFFGIAIYALQNCKKEETNWDKLANKELLSVMKDYYYWYDKLPTVDPNSYKDPSTLIETLRVNPPDRWSYVTTKQELEAYYNSGAYYGFGFGSSFDQNGKLWIIYVYKSSPFTEKGINRGWQISSIDGVTPTPENYNQIIGESAAGVSKTIVFISPDGNSFTYTFTKFEVAVNSVLFDSVYTISSKKIAYMVLNTFITPTIREVNTCFAKFKSENVDELIVDLRYNGGGSISVSDTVASLIGGNAANGGVYTNYVYNDKHSDSNKSIFFRSLSNTLTLNRVVFITDRGTASASELVINGLKPFMPVCLIGSKTHGKPVGMRSFTYNEVDWAFLPVCFSLKNANNEGDYFDGLAVNVDAADDVSKPFGDFREASFAAALTYLGVSTGKGEMIKTSLRAKRMTGKGLYEEIGAW
ncbi:MAG: hypothetical protein HOO91_03195 [Bacteroidales bacterium]|nr:hypothetical protein [Bacteroidales bacterium]